PFHLFYHVRGGFFSRKQESQNGFVQSFLNVLFHICALSHVITICLTETSSSAWSCGCSPPQPLPHRRRTGMRSLGLRRERFPIHFLTSSGAPICKRRCLNHSKPIGRCSSRCAVCPASNARRSIRM